MAKAKLSRRDFNTIATALRQRVDNLLNSLEQRNDEYDKRALVIDSMVQTIKVVSATVAPFNPLFNEHKFAYESGMDLLEACRDYYNSGETRVLRLSLWRYTDSMTPRHFFAHSLRETREVKSRILDMVEGSHLGGNATLFCTPISVDAPADTEEASMNSITAAEYFPLIGTPT